MINQQFTHLQAHFFAATPAAAFPLRALSTFAILLYCQILYMNISQIFTFINLGGMLG